MPKLKKANRLEIMSALEENVKGYRTINSVVEDYKAVAQVSKKSFYKEQVPFSQMLDGLNIYSRAGRTQLDFTIIGRNTVNKTRIPISTDIMPVIDDIMVSNFQRLNEEDGISGSILRSRNWSFYKNDMFIAGAVNNQKPVYLASRRTISNLWESGHPTIFARELAGLFGAGYKLQRLQDRSEVMIPTCSEGSRALNIKSYLNIRNNFLKSDNLGFIAYPNIKKFNFIKGEFIPQFRATKWR